MSQNAPPVSVAHILIALVATVLAAIAFFASITYPQWSNSSETARVEKLRALCDDRNGVHVLVTDHRLERYSVLCRDGFYIAE